MIFRAGKKKVNDEIPTASMADIAFLLIIYFMVTTTFAATRGLDWALPKDEDNPPLVEKEEAVLIEIQPAGNLVVDGSVRFAPLAGGDASQGIVPADPRVFREDARQIGQ